MVMPKRRQSFELQRFTAPTTHILCECRCLGQEDAADLRAPLRASEGNGLLSTAIDEAIGRKPKGHGFVIDRVSKQSAVARHMSVTGGGGEAFSSR